LGREIRSFEYEKVPRVSHQVVWDGKNDLGGQVSSGVYLYRATVGGRSVTRKMLLLK
jgi:flagellar hook assembly protein FlgD